MEEIQTHQINTVAYGTALFLAVRAIHFLADTYATHIAVGAEPIKTSFYIEDFLSGSDSMEQLKQMKTEVIEILKLGYMELVKWHSNLPEFVDDQTMKDLNIDDGFVTSALGVA